MSIETAILGALPREPREFLVSLNLNALDDIDPAEVRVGYFDGRHDNWHAGSYDEPWPIRA